MNFAMALPGAAPAAAVPAAATVEHRKLVDAAQQFEGMLLQEMLKPMKEHEFCEGDAERSDDGNGSGFADTLSSYGTEAMATAIAKGGGLGIARRVVAQVEGEKMSRTVGASGSKPPEFQNKTAAVLKFPRTPPMS
jgi:Rod binding domain-containing protein